MMDSSNLCAIGHFGMGVSDMDLLMVYSAFSLVPNKHTGELVLIFFMLAAVLVPLLQSYTSIWLSHRFNQ